MATRALLLIAFILAACGSSQPIQDKEKFPNQVELAPPDEDQPSTSASIYIDSVKIVEVHHSTALRIFGKFSNGCAQLKEATIISKGDELQLQLRAWQPTGVMCTQALVPFSFIFNRFSEQKLRKASDIQINHQYYNLSRL